METASLTPMQEGAVPEAAVLAAQSPAPGLPDVLALAFEGVVRLAMIELGEGVVPHIGDALGLEARDLARLADFLPPTLARVLHSVPVDRLAPLESEEEALIDLLKAECALPGVIGGLITRITARRAMRNDHLWQDMGLPERPALSQLIALVWPQLHAKNTGNMRWKRFFYRALCEAEGFSLCSVPHCRECTEYDACFGEESGESAFARRVVQLESLKAAE